MRRLAFAGVLAQLVACSSRDRGPGSSPTELVSATPADRLVLVGTSHPVDVRLATSADRPFHVRDRQSGVGVAVRLRGALANATAKVTPKGTVFAAGFLGRHDVTQKVAPEGVEDFVRFDEAPAAREVEYQVDLDAEVAGLRLVSNILELLDHRGVPRLRMAPPWIESGGIRHDVAVDVTGCRVDVNGQVPWERPVVAPGARSCVVRLHWDSDVTYPALLDPSWVSTGSASVGHNNGATTIMANGDVLVTGGCTLGTNLTAVSEIYGATTGVFTTTTALPSKRANHTASLLADGSVLVAGGDSVTTGICFSTGNPVTTSAVLKSGTWTTNTNVVARTVHTASVLASGKVLIAGGRGTAGHLSSAEIFDPATKTWSAAGNMASPHSVAAQVTLTSGDVIVTGGFVSPSTASAATARYQASSGTWKADSDMGSVRAFHAMAARPDGTAVVAGGKKDNTSTPSYAAAIELYAPATGSWTASGTLPKPRQNLGGLALPSGNVLFVGGTTVSGATYTTYGDVDLITTTNTRESWPSLALTRATPGLSLFGAARDRVIVLGGVTVGAVPVSAEITKAGSAAGATCTSASTCALSLVCSGGVCASSSSGDAGTDAASDASDSSVGDTGAADSSTTDTKPVDTSVADTAVSDTRVADSGADISDSGLAVGAACSSATACGSGFCVDGVCCDAACSSPCLACSAAKNISGVDGNCAPAKADAADPRGSCTDEGASSCGKNGRCDGAGGCALYAAGTTCPSGSCDGAGTCDTASDAGLDAPADAPIATDAGSDVPFTPTDPTATPTISSGLATTCTANGECASGHCVDGVCCDRACDGVCESCVLPSSPGKCALVPLGLDPKKACSAIPCQRTCGGTGECVAAFVGSQCSISRCTSPNAGEGPTVCSAVGASCPAPVAFNCGAYACNPAFGACLRDCRASDDCAPGNLCDIPTGRCVPASAEEDSGGCSVQSSGTSHRDVPMGILAALCAVSVLGGLRRRATRGR